MNGSETSPFVVLKNGIVLPAEPVMLALDLENRGLQLRVENRELAVGPRNRLNDDDRQRIRRWKLHLIEILEAADEVTIQ
jgi:hypothetical protein